MRLGLGMALTQGGRGGGLRPLLFDTFTDPNGTTLTAHTMDIGPGWAVTAGTDANVTIQANRAFCGSATVEVRTADAGAADVTITGTLNVAGTSASILAALVGRCTDGNNFWQLALYNDGFYLFEVNAGVVTQRGFVAKVWTANTDYAFSWTMVGNDHTCTVDGGSTITFSSAVHAAATRHGIRLISDSILAQRLDTFLVYAASLLMLIWPGGDGMFWPGGLAAMGWPI